MSDAPSRPAADASRVRRWGPLVLWVVGLLVATSWPQPRLPDVPQGDKVVHALMYAGLAVCAWRAFFPHATDGRFAALVIVAATSAFGWADEWHQQFIPGRSRDAADWAADTAGAAIAATTYALLRRGARPS